MRLGRDTSSEEFQARRRFLKVCIGGCSVITLGGIVYPIISYIQPPELAGGSKVLEIPLDMLTKEDVIKKQYQGQIIYIVNTRGEINVFSSKCTHAGCLVLWDREKKGFICPCHGAFFSDKGEPVKGPIKDPLIRIAFKEQEGKIIIGGMV